MSKPESSTRRVPSDVWKWISAVLVSILITMGGYIFTIQSQIRTAIQEEYALQSRAHEQRLQVLEGDVDELQRNATAGERRIDAIEKANATEVAQLVEIQRDLSRIERKLDALQ